MQRKKNDLPTPHVCWWFFSLSPSCPLSVFGPSFIFPAPRICTFGNLGCLTITSFHLIFSVSCCHSDEENTLETQSHHQCEHKSLHQLRIISCSVGLKGNYCTCIKQTSCKHLNMSSFRWYLLRNTKLILPLSLSQMPVSGLCVHQLSS